MKQQVLIALVFCLASSGSFAQGIMNAELNVAPMTVNPAFTGAFKGAVRINTFYNNQWAIVYVPYVSNGISADTRIITDKKGNYIATGLQFDKAKAGDGNLSNFSGLVSVAYDKVFKCKNRRNASDLAIGLQTGYVQSSIGLTNLFTNPPPTTQFHLGLGNSVNYYPVNAGISFAHSFSEHFSFMIGFAGYNLNQPVNDFEKKQNAQTGYDKQYIGSAGVNIFVTKRFSFRPAAYHMNNTVSGQWQAGNDFCYNISKSPKLSENCSLFMGAWYRTGGILMGTVGAELGRLRIGVAFDYRQTKINTASNGNGGLCVSAKYIAPGGKHKRGLAHNRF